MSRDQILAVAVILLALAVAAVYVPWRGTGGRVQVTGRVLLEGVPVEAVRGSKIGFSPAEAAGGKPPANGPIDEQGRFRLGTFAPGDGVLPGVYRVSVTAYTKTPDYRDSIYFHKPLPSAVPERYCDSQTSDLIVEVTPERSQTIDIKLVK